jgi:hypothetical protein
MYNMRVRFGAKVFAGQALRRRLLFYALNRGGRPETATGNVNPCGITSWEIRPTERVLAMRKWALK